VEFEGIIGVLCALGLCARAVSGVFIINIYRYIYSSERGIAKFGSIREREGLFYKYFESDKM